MSAHATVLKRRPPTIRRVRPEAPTLPADGEGVAFQETIRFEDAVTIDGFFGQHVDPEDLEDLEERTQLRTPPSIEPPTPRLRDSRFDETRKHEEAAEILASVEQLAKLDTTTRMDASGTRLIVGPPQPEVVRTRSGINAIVRDAPVTSDAPAAVEAEAEKTRIGTPRAVAALAVGLHPPTGPLPAPPPRRVPAAPATAALPTPAPVARAPVAQAPVAQASTTPPAVGTVPPGFVPAPVVPAPVPTARSANRRAAKGGSRVVTFFCGVLAVGAAIFALAESPIGYRPEVTPYASVVRHGTRVAAGAVYQAALDVVAQVEAYQAAP